MLSLIPKKTIQDLLILNCTETKTIQMSIWQKIFGIMETFKV